MKKKVIFILCMLVVINVAVVEKDIYAKNNDKYVVAIIDSGINYNHKDILDNLWINETGLKGDYGYDFINDDSDPMDDCGSGTHTASILLQEAIKYNIKDSISVMSLKCSNKEGYGLVDNVVDAYKYILACKKRGVKICAVINNWVGVDNPKELEDIILATNQFGIITISTAGNNNNNIDIKKMYPACYNNYSNINVTAVNNKDELASFASYGKMSCDVAAKGTDMIGAYIQDSYVSGLNDDVIYIDFEDSLKDYNELLLGENINQIDFTSYKGKRSLCWNLIKTVNEPEPLELEQEMQYKNEFIINIGDISEKVDELYGDKKDENINNIDMDNDNVKNNNNDLDNNDENDNDIENNNDENDNDNNPIASEKDDIETEIAVNKNNIDNIYIGFSYTVNCNRNNTGACYILAFEKDKWSVISTFMLNKMNFWDTKFYKISKNVTKLKLLCTDVNSNFNMYLDNIGLGKNDGAYAITSNTSNSSAIVCAEYVFLKYIYPKEDNITLKTRIIGGVKKNLQGIVVSDGVVDVDLAKNSPGPVCLSVEQNNDDIIINGKFFGNKLGTININNNITTVKSWSDNRIVINKTKLKDGLVEIYIKTNRGLVINQLLILKKNQTSWIECSPLPKKLKNAVTIEMNGLIYIIGGETTNNEPSLSVYVYDTMRDSWNTLKSLPEQEYNGCYTEGMCASTVDNKILLIALDKINDKNIFLEFDTNINKWNSVNYINVPSPKKFMTAVNMSETVYLFGGISNEKISEKNNVSSEIWRLSNDRSTWELVGNLQEPVYGVIATCVDNQIIITGGKTIDGEYSTKSYKYNNKNLNVIKNLPIKGLYSNNTICCGGDSMYIMTDGDTFGVNGLYYDVKRNGWFYFGDRLGYTKRLGMFGNCKSRELYVMGGIQDNRVLDSVQSINLVNINYNLIVLRNMFIIIIFTIIFVITTYYLIGLRFSKK